MLRASIIAGLLTIMLGSMAFGQASPTPMPLPTPAKRRPMLDQFDVGVFANSRPPGPATQSAVSAPPSPAPKSELVDQATYDMVTALIEKSAFLGTELERVLRSGEDIAPSSRFRKYFEHQIEGLLSVSSIQRTGAFGSEGISSPGLADLMKRNERTAVELFAVLDVGPTEYARFTKEMNTVSAKYGVPLLDSPPAVFALDRRALLKAMMAEMNRNYAEIKRRMAVAK